MALDRSKQSQEVSKWPDKLSWTVQVGASFARAASRPDRGLIVQICTFSNQKLDFIPENEISVANSSGCIYLIRHAVSCYDQLGRLLLAIVFSEQGSSSSMLTYTVAYLSLASGSVATHKIHSTSSPVQVIALPSSDVVLLVPATQELLVLSLSSSGQSSIWKTQVPTTNFGLPSLVHVGGNLDHPVCGDLEFSVLLQGIHDAHSPTLDNTMDVEETQPSGDIWRVVADMHLLDSDRILKNAASSSNNHHGSVVNGSSKLNTTKSSLAHLVLLLSDSAGAHYALRPWTGLDSLLPSLPQEPITHIYFGSTVAVATQSGLSQFTLPSNPKSFYALPAPIDTLAPAHCSTTQEELVCRLYNGASLVIALPEGKPFWSAPSVSASSVLALDAALDGNESLLLVDPLSSSNSFSWQDRGLGAPYTVVPVITSSDAHSAQNKLGESVHKGLQRRRTDAHSRDTSLASSVDSLLTALDGRLSASKLSLDEAEKRLDAKHDLLRRAILLLSRLGNSQEDQSLQHTTVPFPEEHGLAELLGRSSNGPMAKPPSSTASPEASPLSVLSARCAHVNSHYVLQLSLRNIQNDASVAVDNVLVSLANAPAQSFASTVVTIPPHKIGIVSSTFQISSSAIDPSHPIYVSLEIRNGPRSANASIFNIGRVLVEPIRSPSPTPFPSCPYSIYLVAKSNSANLETLLPTLLSSQVGSRVSSSDPSSHVFTGSSGVTVHSVGFKNLVEVRIGAMAQEDIVGLVTVLNRELNNDVELHFHPLSADWLNRCSNALNSLKSELQAYVNSENAMDSDDPPVVQAAAAQQWKHTALKLQIASDVSVTRLPSS